MISVIPIQQKEEQEYFCRLCGIPYSPDLLAYYAKDGEGRFAGLCQFKTDAEGGHIYHLTAPEEAKNLDPLFVMGRAALNFIDLCGIKTAFFDGECADDALLRRIGFSLDESGRYTINLDGFFTKGCGCHPQ
jgi:hypothetical protein